MNLERVYESLYIDGRWVPSAGTQRIEVISPTTEGVVGSVPHASTEDVDRAVAAARRAFGEGAWPRMTPDERCDVLRSVRDQLRLRRDDFAALITEEMG